MIVIQKFQVTGIGEEAIKRFTCVASGLSDMESAVTCGLALSDDWAPTTPEEGIYIYDPTTNVVAHKFVNGIQVW